MAFVNPYWGQSFFSFFSLFFTRLFRGEILSLAPDEVQVFVLSLVAIAFGVVGPFLVLKRMTMFVNSLSHTILLGILCAYLGFSSFFGGGIFDLSTLLLGALFSALFTAALTEGICRIFHLQEDAGIGLVFTSLFALSIILVALYTRDVHLGIEAVMGNVDALRKQDLHTTGALTLIAVTTVGLFYRSFVQSAFDRSRLGGVHFLLVFLASLLCVGAFRSVGVLLVLAFLVGPYLIARLFFHHLKRILFASALIGIVASFLAVATARHLLTVYDLALSTGGLVTCWIALLYGMALSLKKSLQIHSLRILQKGRVCERKSPS